MKRRWKEDGFLLGEQAMDYFLDDNDRDHNNNEGLTLNANPKARTVLLVERVAVLV